MRTHSEIIDGAGGYQKMAALLGEPVGRVRFWHRRNSIPAEAWKQCADKRISSLKELAEAAASRQRTAA